MSRGNYRWHDRLMYMIVDLYEWLMGACDRIKAWAEDRRGYAWGRATEHEINELPWWHLWRKPKRPPPPCQRIRD